MHKQSDLKDNQNDAIDRLFDQDETLLIAPKGFGKCVVAFTAMKDLIDDGVLKRILVLSTAQVCSRVWDFEARQWDHLKDMSYVCLTGSTIEQREKLIAENSPIVICNFELLPWLLDKYPKKTFPFDGLLVDEITKLKSVGGVGFKKLRTKTKFLKWSVGMTADPVAQEQMEIYGQMLIIDQGTRLGRNKENFQRKYFMQMDYMGNNWQPQPGGLARLAKVLSDVIYTVDSTDYEDSLPELIDIEVPVILPDATRQYYEEMLKHNFVYINHQPLEAANAAILQSKLFQMCCGSVIWTPEDDKFVEGKLPKKKIIYLHDVKMRALDRLLKTIDTPVLISYQFTFQREALEKKYNAPVFSASNSKKVSDDMLTSWNDGTLPIMLVHSKSAAHGLNLQYGPGFSLIMLSYLWSADEWGQLIARLRRRGQKSKIVNRYTIFCKDTVEDCVMKPRLDSRDESSEIFHSYIKSNKFN